MSRRKNIKFHLLLSAIVLYFKFIISRQFHEEESEVLSHQKLFCIDNGLHRPVPKNLAEAVTLLISICKVSVRILTHIFRYFSHSLHEHAG